MISAADQDYIKAIYKLQQAVGDVPTSSLAAALGVTAASVSGMLKKLSQARLVTHRHYRGVRLTEKGRHSALEVLRRHRLIELFLVEILGMQWDSVHQEAEKLEHAVSDAVLARMDEVLGFPERDPHGSSIPSPEGQPAGKRGIRLDQVPAGRNGIVCEVSDEDPDMLRHLSKIGLVPGTKVSVSEVLTIDGTIMIRCGKRKHGISPKVATAVWINGDE